MSARQSAVQSCLVFSYPTVSKFLKGLLHTYPPVRELSPAWDLNTVLLRLVKSRFEPRRMFLIPLRSEDDLPSSCYFSQNSEWAQALLADPPLQHSMGTRQCETLLETYPQNGLRISYKAAHQFTWILPETIFSIEKEKKLHKLDVSRTLLWNTHRTKPFRLSTHRFLAIAGHSKGQAPSFQKILPWITECISFCYQLTSVPHFIAAQLTLMPASDMCQYQRSARWWYGVSHWPVIKHDVLELAAKSGVMFRKAVL